MTESLLNPDEESFTPALLDQTPVHLLRKSGLLGKVSDVKSSQLNNIGLALLQVNQMLEQPEPRFHWAVKSVLVRFGTYFSAFPLWKGAHRTEPNRTISGPSSVEDPLEKGTVGAPQDTMHWLADRGASVAMTKANPKHTCGTKIKAPCRSGYSSIITSMPCFIPLILRLLGHNSIKWIILFN